MIKTRLTSEALKRALEKHQRWLDEHIVVDERHEHDNRERIDALERRRRLLKLRMAKADLRPDRDV